MTELEKWKLINSCQTKEALASAVLQIADNDEIEGWSNCNKFDSVYMANKVFDVLNKNEQFNSLTRNYGIRQQAMYIDFYKNHDA